ncbi:DUF3846 domain-containing protein [Paenibacillus pasadenensis]|uniref:DUF3846 domain-containing protein n=1 Tax=Paenibacillus pasadenensis TaxID=217090 RepID=UPI000C7D2174|nr:DUF3846 domain-containing protein [Paenibacillus pasadenensis]
MKKAVYARNRHLHLVTQSFRLYVVTKQPLEDARIVEWPRISLDSQQKFIGGLIEIHRVGINDEFSFVFHKEGKFLPDLKPNIKLVSGGRLVDIIVGPILVLKVDHHGQSIRLTAPEAAHMAALLNRRAISEKEMSKFDQYLEDFRR